MSADVGWSDHRVDIERCVVQVKTSWDGADGHAEGEQFANAFFTLETKIKIAKM